METTLERTILEMSIIANHKGNKAKVCVIWHPKGQNMKSTTTWKTKHRPVKKTSGYFQNSQLKDTYFIQFMPMVWIRYSANSFNSRDSIRQGKELWVQNLGSRSQSRQYQASYPNQTNSCVGLLLSAKVGPHYPMSCTRNFMQ